MEPTIEHSATSDKQSDGLNYLSHRVRQEAAAAIHASSVEATTIHVILATVYAMRLRDQSALSAHSAAERWVAQHRVW